MIKCEFDCPYFRDPAIGKFCPARTTMSREQAIENCAKIVSAESFNRLPKVVQRDLDSQALEIGASLSGYTFNRIDVWSPDDTEP
ncbi:hypothetical protein HY025_00600 [Candidatus Daviesbacteria bacterium]|nr:hypothetical protein [Candidatus Daviesbacteria bacterium]